MRPALAALYSFERKNPGAHLLRKEPELK